MDFNDVCARLDAVEMKLAYLEDFLDRLQDQVVERGAATDRMAAEHASLKEKVLQILSELEEIPNRKPPHY
jgi:SlyX protein